MSSGSIIDATPAVGAPRATPSHIAEQQGKKRPKRKRVSKWDRPPAPKDWRWFVGGVGKILIALGLLTFGFVAYQLWGTGIETRQSQNRLGAQFDAQIAAVAPTEPGTADDQPNTSDNEPVTTVAGGVVTADDQKLPSAPSGAIMKLEIPKIDLVQYVVPGVGVEDLKQGVGHFPTTPWPGQLGRAGLAGHRTTYGGPFLHLDQLAVGDEIIVTRIDGQRYVFSMTDSLVIEPDQTDVLAGDPTEASLLLLTCTPVHTASHRLVINASLLPDRSSFVGEATFYEQPQPASEAGVVAEGSATPAAEQPTVDGATPTDDAVTQSTQPTATWPTNDGDAGTASATTVLDSAGLDAEAAQSDAQPDAGGFDRGWFEDDEAWPVVLGWGAALLALYVLSRLISRATRHTSVGFLITVVPFVFCLYFFYQGVHRLLPAGI